MKLFFSRILRKKQQIAGMLLIAFLLFMSLQTIGRNNLRNYYLNRDYYETQEWKGWRFSLVPLPRYGQRAIGHWHWRTRCSGISGANLGLPCDPKIVNRHSEEYVFLWFSWKRQLPMDSGPYLNL